MMNTHKEAHVELNGTVKRFQITDNFTEFKKNCEKSHDLPADALDNYIITYIDDEEDKVIISNEFDYDQAMLFLTNPKILQLRINLELKNSLHDLTKINITQSLQLQDFNDDESIRRDNSEKYLDFDDLQLEIDLQKKELEEERLRSKLELEQSEGIRESHYNMIDISSQINSNLNGRKEVKEEIRNFLSSEGNKSNEKNSEEMPLNIDVDKKLVNIEKVIEERHDNPENQEKIDEICKQDGEVQLIKNDIIDEEIKLNSEAEKNKPNDYEISLEQEEDLLKEKRKLSVLEKIRKKAQEDLLKNNLPLIKEHCEVKEINVNIIKIEDDSQKVKPIEIEVEVQDLQLNPAENRIVKKEDGKRCHLRRKGSNDIDLNKSFTGDFSSCEAELKERIVNATVKLIDKKLNKFKEIIINKTIKRTDKIISKYIEYLNKSNDHGIPKQNQEVEVPQKEISIHEDIRCDGCNTKPILGDRYKCSICENFDLCEKCEEENFQKENKHPHFFIRIRQPILSQDVIINPMSVSNSVDLPLQIEPKNSDNIRSDINLIISDDTYSSECLSHVLELNYYLDSKENPQIGIILKNNGLVSWPKPSFLGCLKEKSSITCLTIPIASKINPTGEINLEIKFDFPEDKQSKPGNYICFLQLYHSSSKIYFGEEICVFVNVIEPEYMIKFNEMNAREKKKYTNLVKDMRESYQIGEETYPDSQILKALVKENGDKEKALMELLENLN